MSLKSIERNSSNYILEFPEEHSMEITVFVFTELFNIRSMMVDDSDWFKNAFYEKWRLKSD